MNKTIKIEGMSCDHCKMRVEKALSAVEGVSSAEVSLQDKQATVSLASPVQDDVLKNAVTEAGYDVVSID